MSKATLTKPREVAGVEFCTVVFRDEDNSTVSRRVWRCNKLEAERLFIEKIEAVMAAANGYAEVLPSR